MGTIVITSRLGEDFREDLEQVMFFNPKQRRAEADIKRCVELFGVPEITSENGYLRIRCSAASIAQTLYSVERTATRDTLAGAIVYVRDSIEDLSILHIAIAQKYILQGPVATARLVWDLMRQVIASAAQIRGVRNVKLPYFGSSGKSRGPITSIPVSQHSHQQALKKLSSDVCPDDAITCFEYEYCHNCPEKGVSKRREPLMH